MKRIIDDENVRKNNKNYDLTFAIAKPVQNISDSKCWLSIFDIPPSLVCHQGSPLFEELWELLPSEKHGVIRRRAFKNDYSIEGFIYKSSPIPECLKPYEEWIALQGDYNQIMIYGFENGLDYTFRPYREGGIIKDSSFLVLCLGQARTFRISQANGNLVMEFKSIGGSGLLFGGETKIWMEYRHGIMKNSGEKAKMMGKRIEIWFRKIKCKGSVFF